ncbi:MAG: type II toxin-antitoxin system RelB/DinJ family antitoxin [Desulfovibrio sp.]|jgi:addiction module RelB/DinJ family antitoxin|nr:type II toxin-antitoxin system RelB/DinJ family antitoxin [Desulfovibrio sp.]
MPEGTIFPPDVDSKTKQMAVAVLANYGLSLSDAFDIMVAEIAKTKRFPFAEDAPGVEAADAAGAAADTGNPATPPTSGDAGPMAEPNAHGPD